MSARASIVVKGNAATVCDRGARVIERRS